MLTTRTIKLRDKLRDACEWRNDDEWLLYMKNKPIIIFTMQTLFITCL